MDVAEEAARELSKKNLHRFITTAATV